MWFHLINFEKIKYEINCKFLNDKYYSTLILKWQKGGILSQLCAVCNVTIRRQILPKFGDGSKLVHAVHTVFDLWNRLQF